jgi:autotransporter translocation and assembly factor TamB
VLVVLLGGFRLAMLSDWMRGHVVAMIENTVGDLTGAQLTIGSHHGDLYKGLRLEQVALVKIDTLMRADTIIIDYSLWPMVRKSIMIGKLEIDGLWVNIDQDSTGVINLSTLLPESDDTSEGGSGWSIILPNIYLNNGTVTYRSFEGSFQDPLNIRGITAVGSYRLTGVNWVSQMRSLEFEANHAMLSDAIGLSMVANADNEIMSIESLLLEYGKTLANVTGTYSILQDSVIAELKVAPLSADDVNSLIDPVMVQNLNVDLSIKGSMNKIETLINVYDGSLEILNVVAHLAQRDSLYGLSYLSAKSPGFKMGDYILLPDMDEVRFAGTDIQFAGWAPFGDLSALEGDAKLQTSNLVYETYRAGSIEANMTQRDKQATIDLKVRTGNNRLDGKIFASNIMSDVVNWRAQLTASVQNLRQFDTSQTIPISFKSNLRANGTGISMDGLRSKFDGFFTEVSVDGQKIDRIDVAGNISNKLYVDSLVVAIGQGRLMASGTSSLDFELPVYDITITARSVDMSEIVGFEELITDLNATMSLSGIGYKEQNRNINIELKADSSWVNQTRIDQVDASIVLARNMLFIEDASLASEIADGTFKGDFAIDDVFRPSNNLVFNLNLKNLQPLAPLVGVDILRAKGEIRGRVEQGAESPQLVAIVALDDIAYDSIFVSRVVGQYVMDIQNAPSYQADLELISPNINGTLLEDIRFTSRGKIVGNDLSGQFGIDLNVQAESGISLAGVYSKESDKILLTTKTFDIRGPTRTYRQVSDFNLIYVDDIATSDTLILRAEPDAQLLFQVRHLSADSTALWLDARNVNLEALQTAIMVEPVVTGLMTGNVSVSYAEEDLTLDAFVDLWDLTWEDLVIDSVHVNASIDNEIFVGTVRANRNGMVMFDATMDVPFRLGDPNEFDDLFFNKPVHATLLVDSLDLSNYIKLFEQFDLPVLTGTLKATSTLSGIAGVPEFVGEVTYTNGSIGGIPVDRLELGWNYNQSLTQLSCNASLSATGQQVFSSSFNLPLNLDLRNFSQILPESSDPVDGNLVAQGFNLALVSQFLPSEYADELIGTVDGTIELQGTIGRPLLDGNLTLQNAGVRVIPGNVLLRNVAANFVFNHDRIDIETLTMRSGSGDLTGSGYIRMDGFDPGELSVDLRARQFTVSDTRDARAVISFDSKLVGTLDRPELTGSMIVNSANIYLDNFGERIVEDVQLEGEEPLQAPSMYDSLSIRMRVQVDPNVWMRNRTSPELAIELLGDLDLLKDSGSDLMAFGSLSTRQGYAMQYGKRFQIERGQLTFSGDPFNPNLDIVSLYELRVPEDIEIRYLIGGTVSDPTFDFTSNPEMELENIISYTLFGKPFGALFTWQQSFSGGGGGSALARDAAIGVLVDRLESLATESLGIDVLQIDSNRQGETVTTSIKAGKYITDKLFVAVLNELGGSEAVTRVVLEYYIRRNLLLVVTQGNDRRSGIDILWKYEY